MRWSGLMKASRENQSRKSSLVNIRQLPNNEKAVTENIRGVVHQ